jgi:hypothetical protein
MASDDGFTTRQHNYALYVRDRWNVTPSLTLSYGVRWEYYPFPTRDDRGMEWYDGAQNKMLVCGVGVAPKDCGVSTSKKLFAPRLGVAWRATSSLVVRAGYGLTYDPFSLQRPFRTNYPVLLIQAITADSLQATGKLSDGLSLVKVPDLGNGILDVPGTLEHFGIDHVVVIDGETAERSPFLVDVPAHFTVAAVAVEQVGSGGVIVAGQQVRKIGKRGKVGQLAGDGGSCGR